MDAQIRFVGTRIRSFGRYSLIALTLLGIAIGISIFSTSGTFQPGNATVAPQAVTVNGKKTPSPVLTLTSPTQQVLVVEEAHLAENPKLKKPQKVVAKSAIEVSPSQPQISAIETNIVGDSNVSHTTAAVNSQCQDVAKTEGNLRRVMGWSLKTLARAQNLTGLKPEELCALPQLARNQLRAVIKEEQAADANGMIEYLHSRHLDASGKVPADALYKAVQQHKQLLEQQALTQKRAGISPTTWTALGPTNTYSGRVNALHIDPRNSAIMIVGTSSGGLWRTANAGSNWYPVDSFSPAFAISGLRADPNNPDTIYATTGADVFAGAVFWSSSGAGLWRSSDNGVTWQSIPSIAPGQLIPNRIPSAYSNTVVNGLADVAVSPISSQIIVVPGSNGVYLTRDWGISWQQVAEYRQENANVPGYISAPTQSFFASFDPKDARKVYIGTSRGTLIVGTGLGTGSEQWQEQSIFSQAGLCLVTTMAWSKDGSRAWITTSEAGGTVYLSTDGGLTFNKLSAPGYCQRQCGYNNVLWVDPTDANRVVVGGVPLYRSADGGVTWEDISFGLDYSWNHLDHHAVLADPGYNGTTNKTVYFGNDGGVFRTTDITGPVWNIDRGNPTDAITWENFGKGINATQFYAIEANSIAGIVLGGTQDNGSFQFRSGTDWTETTGGDGGFAGVPNLGSPLYASSQRTKIWRLPGGGGPEDISSAIRQNDGGLFISPLILDPNNDKRMYVGAKSLWVSDDVSTGMPAWRVIKDPLPTDSDGDGLVQRISAVAVAPGDASQVWIGYEGGSVYRTSNALATTPTWILARPRIQPGQQQVTSIFISPTAPQRVMITLSGWSNALGADNVFRTLDAGASWSDISGNLPRTLAYSVVENPTNPNFLYVGTETGVYATTDGITWSASNDGPALVPVYMLKWYDNSTLLAATFGRGVWRASFGDSVSGTPSQTIGTISFDPTSLSVGGTSTASATATSGLAVSFTSTTPTICTVSGSTVTGIAPGTCTVAANQTGNVAYSAAPQVTQNITVGQASQTIGAIGFSPTALSVGSTVTVSATATSGLAVTYTSTTPTICAVTGSTVTALAEGTCTIAANQAGNAAYAAAQQVTQNITVTSANLSRLINISTRGQISTGDGVMIGGFIISGAANKKVLIRAIGPNLANFGISGTLPDPKLELFEGPTLIGSNDNWQTQAIAADVAAITATGLAPANVAESALLVTLKPGVAYTAVVTGVNVPTGVGIVEVFEADHPEYQLINISTRGRVQSGEGVMIGGFIIQGDTPKTVLIRAVGPNLSNFGVSGVLTDPTIEIYRSSDGVKIASNDDWQTQTIAADVGAITATGLSPADPRESAILLTLPPGAYTAVVSGKGGGTGVGIVEVFAR